MHRETCPKTVPSSADMTRRKLSQANRIFSKHAENSCKQRTTEPKVRGSNPLGRVPSAAGIGRAAAGAQWGVVASLVLGSCGNSPRQCIPNAPHSSHRVIRPAVFGGQWIERHRRSKATRTFKIKTGRRSGRQRPRAGTTRSGRWFRSAPCKPTFAPPIRPTAGGVAGPRSPTFEGGGP